MYTIKEVAKACGVSKSTVSRAYDKNSVIKEKTREYILNTANEMGYVPNIVARGLKTSKSHMVGIIIPSVENTFYLDLLKYIEMELHRHNYRLMVIFLQQGITEERGALETMVYSKVDAIIILTDTRINSDYIEKISGRIKIIQLFAAPYDEYGSVVMNDVFGVEIAVEHLFSMGHTRILYTGGDNRVKGLYNAYNKYGMTVDRSMISLNWAADIDMITDMIKNTNPTAVLAIANQSTTAWKALKKMSLNIPEDISFIAYDDVNWVQMCDVTAIAHPLINIAKTLIESLIELLKSDSINKIILDPYIIERNTVKFIADNDV